MATFYMAKKLNTNEFIIRSNYIHDNKYNYSLTKYKKSSEKVIIICNEHGIFKQNANNHLQGFVGCKQCSLLSKSTSQILGMDEFLIKAEFVHKNKYKYDHVKYRNSKSKIQIICPHHGMFEQQVGNHLAGFGCAKCKFEMLNKLNSNTLIDFFNRAKIVHRDTYDYNLVEYKNLRKKVKIICRIHGIFEQSPGNHLVGQGCPKCKESVGERTVRNFLADNSINFVRQKKFENCSYKYPLSFDFYLPELNTCIEYDGNQHFTLYFNNKYKPQIKICDEIKNQYCIDNNIRLLRIHAGNIKNIKQLL